MIVFTEAQHDSLRKGNLIEREFPARPAEHGIFNCPFHVGMVIAAKRDGSRSATLKVEVRDVWRVTDELGFEEWHVVFGKSAIPHDLRLLKPGGGYTNDIAKQMGAHDMDACDSGEGLDLRSGSDLDIKQAMVKRQATVENAIGSVDLLADVEGLSRDEKRSIRKIRYELSKIGRAA